ncbi:MAG: hypothetical protein ACKVU1_01365 [bacterium]
MMRSARELLPAGILLALVIAFFAPSLFSHYTEVPWDERTFEPWGSASASLGEAPPRAGLTADALVSYYPRRVALHDALREARLPLWSPASFCGAPFVANFQSGAFYPPNWLLAPLAPARAMGVFVALHVFLLGCGALLFLREIGVSRAAAVAGAIAASWNGFVVLRIAHPTAIATLAWIPLLFFFARRVVAPAAARARGSWSVAGLAVSWALAILAGFPPILVYAGYSVAAFVVFMALSVRRESRGARGTWMRPAFVAVAALVCGTGLAAPQLLATSELARFSDRAEISYDSVLSSALHPALGLRLVAPALFGEPVTGDDLSRHFARGDGHYSQGFLTSGCYLGVVVIALAIAGATDRRREARFLAVLACAGLLLAFGSPLLRVFWGVVPGFRIARIDRAIALTSTAVALLAGIGVDRLAASPPLRKRVALACAAVAAVFVALIAINMFGGVDLVSLLAPSAASGPQTSRVSLALLRPLLGALALALAIAIAAAPRARAPLALLCVPLLLVDLGSFATRYHAPRDTRGFLRETPGIEFLRERTVADRAAGGGAPRIIRFGEDALSLLPPNLPGLFGLEDVQGYNALEMGYFMRYVGAIEESARRDRRLVPFRRRESLESPLFRLLASPLVVSTAPLAGRPPIYTGSDFTVTEVPSLPRAFLVHHAVRIDSLAEATATLARGDIDPRLTAIVMGAAVDDLGLDVEPHGQEIGETVTWLDSRPEELRLRVTANARALLTLSEVWYPGWKAFVDGAAAPLLRINGVFRAVVVPLGTHEVRLVYSPAFVSRGAFAAAFSAAVLLAVCLTAARTRVAREGSAR